MREADKDMSIRIVLAEDHKTVHRCDSLSTFPGFTFGDFEFSVGTLMISKAQPVSGKVLELLSWRLTHEHDKVSVSVNQD